MTSDTPSKTRNPWDRLPAPARVLLQYAFAAVTVAAGLGLRWLAEGWVGKGLPTYVTFYPAVMTVALLAGLGPGLAATVFTALTAAYWILPPEGFQVDSPVDRLGMVLFVCMATFMTLVAGLYRRSQRRASAYASELALRTGEERFRMLFQQAAVGIKRLDPQGRMLEVNDRFCEILGYSREELLRLRLEDVTHPEDVFLERRQLAHLFAREVPNYSLEKRAVRKDGRTIWVRVTSSIPSGLEAGSPWWISVVEDITDRKRAEESVRQSEERYRSLFETMLEGFCTIEMIFDADGKPVDYRFMEINPAFEAQTGLHDAQGKRMRELAPNHEAHWFEIYGKVALTGEPARFENEAKALGRYYDVSAYRIGGAESRRVGILFSDITDRKRVEEEMRRSEARLRTILDALPVAVFLSDPQGNIVFTNAAVDRIWGISLHVRREEYGEYKGRWLKDDSPVEPEQWALARVLETGEPFVNDPVALDRAGQASKIIHNFALPIRDDAGELMGVVVVTEDVTERTRAQEQVRHAKDAAEELAAELTRSNQDLEQFAYVASHDLQEPLRAVAGFMGILRSQYQGKLDAAAQEYIGHAVEGAERMQALINDLLTFSRVGSKGGAFRTMNFQDALDNALSNLQVAIEESGAVITADALPTVVADASQMTQLLQNLIANAIKFRGAQRPEIHVGAVRGDGGWRFSVSDNGIGIEPQYYERIFLIFQRLHGRTRYAGTGIGLAVCKKIVERHGGTIRVESRPGEGSTFSFTIPDRGEDS